MAPIRRLPLLQDKRSPEAVAATPGWPWVVLGTSFILALWVVTGLLVLDRGPWAVVAAFSACAALGGALVGRLARERPVRSAATAGLCAALTSVLVALGRGALGSWLFVLCALLVLLVTGTASSAFGGKVAARRSPAVPAGPVHRQH